jgi:hypothetical protein
MKEKIKEWYLSAYPTDDMGEDINPDMTFEMLYVGMKLGSDPYKLIGVGDSVIRERCFSRLAIVTNESYKSIYNLWSY